MALIIFLIDRTIWIYEVILFIRVILSWVQPNQLNPFVRFLYRVTDPLLDTVRQSIPFLAQGGIDLSPIVVFFLLEFTRRTLTSFLINTFM